MNRVSSRGASARTTPSAVPAVVPALVVVLCAFLSIAISGHRSGQSNNIFHLPILLKLYDEPQFARDAFTQSLRHYSSGFWMMLAGTVDDRHVLDLFLPLQIASRILFFSGVLAMARPLGILARREQCLFLLLVAITVVMRNGSPAGNGGLFIAQFTHSELANATVLLCLALAARDRFGWATVLLGVTFFLNVFMAVWLAVPLAVLIAMALRRGTTRPRALFVQLAWGGLLCLPMVFPVVRNILANPEFGKPPAFDYQAYLGEYWPNHFLVWDIPRKEILKLFAITAAAIAAATALPSAARRLALTLIAAIGAVWLIGTIVPLVTASPAILNLHLLRSSAILVIFATLALAAFGTRLFASASAADRLIWAPLLVALIAVKSVFLPLAVLLVIARRFWSPPAWTARPAFAALLLTLVGAAVAAHIAIAVRKDVKFREAQGQWLALSRWARDHTAPGAIFLLPAINSHSGGPLPKGMHAQAVLASGHEIFASIAHRVVWSGYKEGAAVMWTPGFYPEWKRRVVDTLRLGTLPARLDYARRNDIAMVVDACDLPGPAPVHRVARLCVYSALPAAYPLRRTAASIRSR